MKGNGSKPDHHGPKGYTNPHLPRFDKSLLDVFKMRWTSNWSNHRKLADQVPTRMPDYERIINPVSGLQITWIGHSTFLIQLNGKTILTDPVFSQRASPVGFAGPSRYSEPAMPLSKLPAIDYVVISHNHYDHMDLASISHLAHGPVWFVPLDNAPYLRSVGVEAVVELDWWCTHEIDGFSFTATPAQHWSARGLFDHCHALWSGWVFHHDDHTLFFAGDTGYNPIQFKEIGERLGPFDASMIPIGAYEPRWFMKDMHVNPQEAVRIHLDTNSRQSFAMHWGTFPLTAESPGDPPRQLAAALAELKVPATDFEVLDIGETRTVNASSSPKTGQIL